MTTRVVKVVALVGAAGFLVPGVWAYFWPRSFYENVALFDPFNLHLFHDVGAFQIGIGTALLAALWWRDALFVALVGGTIGAIAHAVSHVIDQDLGGRPSDPWTLGALAVVLAVALVLRLPARTPVAHPEDRARQERPTADEQPGR
jgi:hypothetical protein